MTPNQGTPRTGQAGVTLLEMLIVLAILAILLGVGSAYFLPRRDDPRIDAAAAAIKASLQQAAEAALLDAAPRQWRFSADRTLILKPDQGGWIIDPASPAYEAVLPEGIDISLDMRAAASDEKDHSQGQDIVLMILPDGLSAPCTLRLRDTREGRSLAILFDGLRARIQPTERP
jgi:type II secretion system protein H